MTLVVAVKKKMMMKKKIEYNKRQLAIGRKIELEHTSSKKVAEKIARDHLREFPTYYTALVKMEKGLMKKKR